MHQAWQMLTWLRAALHRVRYPSHPAQRVTTAPQRLVMVQYGDYAEAYRRLAAHDGAENYYAQRYTVDYIAGLARSAEVASVTVVTFARDEPLTELAPRLHAAGVELYPASGRARHGDLLRLVEQLAPTRLIVGAPIVPLLRWGMARGLPVLPLFADSFHGRSLRTLLRNLRLAYVLNDPRIRYVANHNLAAALDLVRIGVAKSKIVPYDWPAVISPAQHPPKKAPPRGRAFRLIYVGQVSEAKGVGDLVRAVAQLRDDGFACALTVIGHARDAAMSALAARLGVADGVSFLGLRSHPEVRRAMHEHDAVVVPSRHEYPEGLPMTLYEGLCSRSPLIVSDHPMFRLRIRPYDNALVFAAGSPQALAAAVRELASQPQLYERLSHAAEQAAEQYLCPLKWDRLINAWLAPQSEQDIDHHLLVHTPHG